MTFVHTTIHVTDIDRSIAFYSRLGMEVDRRFPVHGHEIAVVYYRSGYTPSDYPTPAQWEVRERLEAARCIKVLSAFAVMMISVPTCCSI